jgi:hypothetical protein
LDEARLALNIAARSYEELLRPLDHDQSAPLLYLWLQRTTISVLGGHDWALRLLPLVSGIGLVWLVPLLGGRVLSLPGTIVASALAAFSPLLIHYSLSVKQYGSEAALTLVALHFTLQCRESFYRGAPSVRLTILGALLPWLAAPAAFLIVGVGGCAGVDLVRGTANARRFLFRSVPAWAVSITAAYLVVYEPASRNPYLHRYWSSALLSPGSAFPDRLWALLNENLWGLVLGYPGPPGRHLSVVGFLTVATLLLALILMGAWRLRQRYGWGIVLLTAAPLFGTLVASVAGIYPVSLRLTLFAAPLVQLLLVSGLDFGIRRLSNAAARRAWTFAGCALTVPLLAVSLLQVTRTEPPEDVRTLVEELSRRRHQEPVYVFAGSIPPWTYYVTDWRVPDRKRLEFVARVARASGAAFENAPSRDLSRDEGAGLVYRAPTGIELYGLATGIEWTPSLGPLKRSPDEGWASHEAGRIAAAGAPTVWILMSRFVGAERELFRELERRGACATYVRHLDNAVLVRYSLKPSRSPGKCRVVSLAA